MAEGTKDVTTAQERTDPIPTDMVVLVNAETREVQQLPLNKLGATISSKVAPADFNDFFGLE